MKYGVQYEYEWTVLLEIYIFVVSVTLYVWKNNNIDGHFEEE